MKKLKIPARYAFVVMCFFGTFCTFVTKVGISVAIVDMVDFAALENSNQTENITEQAKSNQSLGGKEASIQCPDRGASLYSRTRYSEGNFSDIRFLWNPSQQGLVLGSYSYGVVASLVLVSYISRRCGHVRVQGCGLLLSAISTLLLPTVAVHGGYIGTVILRIITGIVTGATTSLMVALIALWSPMGERSKMMSIVFAGIPIGVSFIMPVAGLLAGTFGWRSVFYFTGSITALWSLLWLFLIHESPAVHPRISDKEKEYIQESLNYEEYVCVEKRSVPWLKIFKCWPFLCLVLVHFFGIFGRSLVTSMLPTYLRTILRFDVKTTGILSAIPFVASGMLLFVCGPLADIIISRGVRTIIVRKAFATIGLALAGVSMIGVNYAGCNDILSIFLLTMAIATDAFTVPGFKACIMEIAPAYSGVLYSISATLSNTTGILAPQITGLLRQTYGPGGWQYAFWIAGSAYLLGATIFLIFGTNEVQPWAVKQRPRQSVATVTEMIS